MDVIQPSLAEVLKCFPASVFVPVAALDACRPSVSPHNPPPTSCLSEGGQGGADQAEPLRSSDPLMVSGVVATAAQSWSGAERRTAPPAGL